MTRRAIGTPSMHGASSPTAVRRAPCSCSEALTAALSCCFTPARRQGQYSPPSRQWNWHRLSQKPLSNRLRWQLLCQGARWSPVLVRDASSTNPTTRAIGGRAGRRRASSLSAGAGATMLRLSAVASRDESSMLIAWPILGWSRPAKERRPPPPGALVTRTLCRLP